MQDQRFIDELRAILAQDGSIPALRAGLFIFGILATLAWLRRRPLFALCLLSTGSALGIGWWIVQIAFPLGLGTDAALTRDWAQAGIDALGLADGSGFVWGTSPERSLVSTLALLGTPLPVVHHVPQIAAILGLGLLIMLPRALIKDPRTATFAACLVVGGGLWPGVSPYGSILLDPSLVVTAGGTMVVVLILARRRDVRRHFNHSRVGVAAGLTGLAALGRAWADGVGPGAISAGLLISGSLVLASPVRVLLRRASASARAARRNEAFFLLCAFCGSGLFWWHPPKSVPGFAEATDESPALRKPLAWLARNVPAGDVVLTSPAYSALVAALAGRRILYPPPADAVVSLSEPFRRARLAASTLQGRPIARLANAFSLSHLFLGPGEPSPVPGPGTGPDDEPRLSLVLIYEDAEDFRVFRLTKK